MSCILDSKKALNDKYTERLNTIARTGKPLEICGVSARLLEQWHTVIYKDHF